MTDKKTAGDRLEKLAELFRQRNAVYGDTFKSFGVIMNGLFMNRPVTIQTVEDWNRIGTFMHVIDKVSRYGNNFEKGGHHDSLDDVSVYAQILRTLDVETKLKEQKDAE